MQQELRDKMGHRQFAKEDHGREHQHQYADQGHGFGRYAEDKHKRMFANIMDCEVVIARGMGRGAYQGMLQANLKPIVTDIAEVEAAVKAVLDNTIIDHPEALH